jgi:hypothetical protein
LNTLVQYLLCKVHRKASRQNCGLHWPNPHGREYFIVLNIVVLTWTCQKVLLIASLQYWFCNRHGHTWLEW